MNDENTSHHTDTKGLEETVENMRSENRNVGKKWIFPVICVVLVVLQLAVCIYYGSLRKYLFCDEVFSYGLANCEEFSFIDPKENQIPIDHWVSGDFYANYLKYNNDVGFSFRAAFENQKNDVHPPLYYCLLHLVCYFFNDYVYGPVPGIVLNLILLVIMDLLFFYVASYLFQSKEKGLLAAALWGLASCGISNVMLVRMYLLQTLEIMLFIAFHVYVLKHKRKMTVPYFIALACIVALGGLTHYYFYFFVAAFGGLVCLYFLFQKQIRRMFAYGFGLVGGLLMALLVFPATLGHIFGYRGAYATSSLGSFSTEKLVKYLEFVNKSLLAGKMKLVLWIILLVLIWRICRHCFFRFKIGFRWCDNRLVCDWKIERVQKAEYTGQFVLDERTLLFAMLILADIVYAYVAIQGSELVNMRYIYPAYPIMALVVIKVLDGIVFGNAGKCKIACIAACCVIFCYGSIRVNDVEWLYRDYQNYEGQMESITGDDGIVIYHDNGWNNVYECIDVLMNLNSCRYLMDRQVDRISEILSTRPGDNPVLIIFPGDPGYSWEDKQNILNTMVELTDYTGYELKYNFIIEAYELY